MKFETGIFFTMLLLVIDPLVKSQGIVYYYTVRDYYTAFNELPVVVPYVNGSTLPSFDYTDNQTNITVTLDNLVISILAFSQGNYTAQFNTSSKTLIATGSEINMGITFDYYSPQGNGSGIAYSKTQNFLYQKVINFTQGVYPCVLSLDADWTNMTISFTTKAPNETIKRILTDAFNNVYGETIGDQQLVYIVQAINLAYQNQLINPNYFEGYIPNLLIQVWYYNYLDLYHMDKNFIMISMNASLSYPFDGPVIKEYTTHNITLPLPFNNGTVSQVCYTKEYINYLYKFVMNCSYWVFSIKPTTNPIPGFNYTIAALSAIVPEQTKQYPSTMKVFFNCSDSSLFSYFDFDLNHNQFIMEHYLECTCFTETNSPVFKMITSALASYNITFPTNTTSSVSKVSSISLNGVPIVIGATLNITQQNLLTNYTKSALNGFLGQQTDLGSHFPVALTNATLKLVKNFALISGSVVLPDVSMDQEGQEYLIDI